jgi:hypothetical protein
VTFYRATRTSTTSVTNLAAIACTIVFLLTVLAAATANDDLTTDGIFIVVVSTAMFLLSIQAMLQGLFSSRR